MSQKKVSHLSKKIWIAVSTPFQVNFFAPLIKRMENEFEFVITARNHDRIFSMLDKKGLKYYRLSSHGGETLEGRLRSYAENVKQLIPIIKKERPDLLLTERWPEAVRVAFGYDIPSWTIFYDEREYHVNRMVFPLSSRVFVPEVYTLAEMRRNGIDDEKIVWFNGFHTCYLKNESFNQENSFHKLGFESPIVLIRPEPENATFFHDKNNHLEQAVSILMDHGIKTDFNVIVIPRCSSQASCYAKYPVTVLKEALPENPVWDADIVVGAAETMLMEAFVLGKPAISAMYWEESKPVTQLHKYITHTTDPKEIASTTLEYLDPQEQDGFRQRAKTIVEVMDDPVIKMEQEIRLFYGQTNAISVSAPKRRSQLDIYMDIIRSAAFRPLKLTHIMQEANLSYLRVKKDLQRLQRKSLVEINNDVAGEKYYRSTADGLKLLSEFEKFSKVLK